MDPEGASNAIEQLYGKAVAKHSKPLIVEVSQVGVASDHMCWCALIENSALSCFVAPKKEPFLTLPPMINL